LNQEKTIADVIDESSYSISEGDNAMRTELLSDISGGKQPNSRSIAAFMRRNKGRPLNGLVIRRGIVKSGRQLWSVLKK